MEEALQISDVKASYYGIHLQHVGSCQHLTSNIKHSDAQIARQSISRIYHLHFLLVPVDELCLLISLLILLVVDETIDECCLSALFSTHQTYRVLTFPLSHHLKGIDHSKVVININHLRIGVIGLLTLHIHSLSDRLIGC